MRTARYWQTFIRSILGESRVVAAAADVYLCIFLGAPLHRPTQPRHLSARTGCSLRRTEGGREGDGLESNES